MSVTQAILFYSKQNLKSIKLKNIIESLNVDINTVSVDSPKIREALLNDENYSITEIPSVLIVYETDDFNVLTGRNLENWFAELIENVSKLNVPEQIGQTTSLRTTEEPTVPTTSFVPVLSSAPPSSSPSTPVSKEIKKEGPSPAELAKKMAEQREELEKANEQPKPN